MDSPASRLVFVAVSAAVVALFLWLGFWQLDRLEERRSTNDRHRAVMQRPPLRLAAGPVPPADSLRWRRVVLEGRFDYGREMVLAPRSLDGTPAVYLLTPLLVPDPGGGGDSVAVPVLRGAVPAPDGFHAPAGEARPGPGDAARPVTVYGLALPPPDVEPVGRPDTLRTAAGVLDVLPRLDLERVRALLPYPARAVYVQADSSTADIALSEGVQLPIRVAPPRLDDGPHLLYAIQWFSFAAILLVGGGIYLFTSRRPGSRPSGGS